MSFKDGESTVEVLESYLDSGSIESPFLSEEDNKNLTDSIKYLEIFDLPSTFYGFNKLALVKK